MATENYLAAIRAKADTLPRLEQNKLKLLHVKQPLVDWREWSVLTYDHNVLANLLIKENKLLKKKIKEYETKLRMITSSPPSNAYAGWRNLNPEPSRDNKKDDETDDETEDEELEVAG